MAASKLVRVGTVALVLTSHLGMGLAYGYAAPDTAPSKPAKSGPNSSKPGKALRAKAFTASFQALNGKVVGVGMPISLTFNRPIKNKTEIERRLQVTSSPEVEGAWHWFGDRRVDYRPRKYWPAGTTVRLRALLAGVGSGNGAYGQQNRTLTFSIGSSHISVVNVKTHKMKVYEDGELVRTIPITAGKAGRDTWNGIMVATEKYPKMRMNSETVGLGKAYNTPNVPNAVRLTPSGTFVHGNYWEDAKVFGTTNVSHGCIGMKPVDAKWFYAFTRVGDVVQVINSDQDTVAPTNGYGDWNLSWAEWTGESDTDDSDTDDGASAGDDQENSSESDGSDSSDSGGWADGEPSRNEDEDR